MARSLGKFFLAGLIAAVITVVGSTGVYGGPCPTPDTDMNNYIAIPPFITGGDVKPNIMIVLDNSGSMNEFAYKTPGTGGSSGSPDQSYDPNSSYYGYFDPDKMYLYDTSASGHFRVDSSKTLDKTSFWSGNFLNWVTMRRVDITRRVLVGGKATNRAINQPKYILAHDGPDRDFWKNYNGQQYYVEDDLYRCADSSCSSYVADSDGISAYNVKVYTAAVGEDPPSGIIQQVDDRARFGLMFYNKGNKYSQEADNESNKRDGGYVDSSVKELGATSLLTGIENTDPSTWTPLGETLYEVIRVFQGGDSAYTNGNYDSDPKDPLSDNISCQKNFVLIVTDGESTKDKNVPGTYWSGAGEVSDSYGFDVGYWMDKIATNESYASQWDQTANSYDGTYYLEGVAYYAHTTDLRTPSMGRFDIEGTQNLNIYTVYAFDDSSVGRDLLQKTAKYGGFEDRNGNGIPEGAEWDAIDAYGYKYPDGIPDTYYEAQDASNLGPTLLRALFDIFKRAASGSSTSVITTTGEGEGAVYQAFFYPEKTFAGSEEITWVGFMNGLFVDPYGNIREDTNGNKTLDMVTDKIIKMRYDPTIGTLVDLYLDSGSGITSHDGDGIPNDCVSNTEFCASTSGLKLEEIKSLWEAGSELQKISASSRSIHTEDPTSPGSAVAFIEGNASFLQERLRAADVTEAENIINWVRGTEITGYRSRTVTHVDPFSVSTTGVWKLGDIINSSPTTVGRPGENYGFIYGDYTYGVFRNKYNKRRIVVYVGANDGMLHAFNSGFFDISTRKFYKSYDGTSYTDSGSHPELGEELYAYVPTSLLPHLKWMTREDYGHVYFVDMTPKVTDVRIFTSEYSNGAGTHPYGWGTILVGGLRLGGKSICTASETLTAEYFALDITVPESPSLLWTFTPDNGGVTMSRPAILRIDDPASSNAADDKWYMIVGSGPIDYDGFSNITTMTDGVIYIVDLKTGNLLRKITTSESEAFFANPITVDVNLDYKVDVAYIGESYLSGTSYNGKMYRLNTKNDPDPANWTLSVLYSTSEPITAAPTAALDNKGSLWLFFGSGKFLGTDDKNLSDSGKFFGIKDGAKPWLPSSWDDSADDIASYSNLLNVTNSSVNYGGNTVSVSGTASVTNWSSLLSELSSRDGWFIDHENMTLSTDFLGNTLNHAGERVFVKPAVLGGLVVWSTYIPGMSLCSYEGESNVYAVYYKTGTAYFKKYIFSEEYALEKASATPQNEDVSRTMKLGYGMPATIGTMITRGGNLKGFSQQSTGTILEIEAITPITVQSGIPGWKEDEL